MNVDIAFEGEDLLKSIYTKSAEVNKFMSKWKKSVSGFDISEALNEKLNRIQTAMSNYIHYLNRF